MVRNFRQADEACNTEHFDRDRARDRCLKSDAGLLALLAVGLSLIGLAAATPAEAQWFFSNKYYGGYSPPVYRRAPPETTRSRRSSKPANPALTEGKKAPKSADDTDSRPLVAVVSIEDQHVSVYGAHGLIEQSDVSTGKQGHETPTGVYAVIQKERWHESNLYSSAPMPYMQRITWSGVAMHEGQLPGYAASHGCIRLRGEFAQRWYKMTKIGLRVIVTPTDVSPQPIANTHLPEPRYWSASTDSSSRLPVQSAALSVDQLAALAAPASVDLNPVTYAAAEKIKAKAELKASEQAEGAAGDAVEATGKALRDAEKTLRSAEREFAAAEDRLAWFGLIGNQPPPPPRADFGDGLLVARSNYERANTDVSLARQTAAEAERNAAAAKAVDAETDARTEALKDRVAEMGRRQETASIFISRKDQRLYVRQALRPVFDAPVTIRDPDQPVGTHIYVAGPPAPGEKALRWTAFAMPVEARPTPRSARSRRSGDSDAPPVVESAQPSTSAAALDRIEIPRETMDRLGELAWIGSSMIISDHGLSSETELGTDFIVETRY